jgi:hypothetical protein
VQFVGSYKLLLGQRWLHEDRSYAPLLFSNSCPQSSNPSQCNRHLRVYPQFEHRDLHPIHAVLPKLLNMQDPYHSVLRLMQGTGSGHQIVQQAAAAGARAPDHLRRFERCSANRLRGTFICNSAPDGAAG